MKAWPQIFLLLSALTFTCRAQQPLPRAPQPGVPGYPGQPTEKPSTNNYTLELEIKRGDRMARYAVTFSGGQIITELIDKLSDRMEGAEPRIINFNASFIPFDDAGGSLTITMGRSIPFKTRVPVQGAATGTEKEVTQFRSISLLTKVALLPGKAVTIFEDEDERITLKLTLL